MTDTKKENSSDKSSRIYGGKVFKGHSPTKEELEKAKTLDRDACPRRYCWFWRSVKFEFETPVSEGCNAANEFPFNVNPRHPVICWRASRNPYDSDYYESRPSYLIRDGINPEYFDNVRGGESSVYLEISDFSDDPSIVTDLIGLQATRFWKQGEPSAPNSEFSCAMSGWRLYSPLPLSASVEEHVDALVSMLEPHVEGVRQASKQFVAWIRIIDRGSYIRIRLTENIVSRIANLGVGLDIDPYFVKRNEDVEPTTSS